MLTLHVHFVRYLIRDYSFKSSQYFHYVPPDNAGKDLGFARKLVFIPQTR
jgi:hypothetical protein